jgi:hypothetical protein
MWLAVADQFVPRLLSELEQRHYESAAVFRFENSDLFALGPLVSYLREHPVHTGRRVAFFGNSVLWGLQLEASEAVPARYQQLRPATRAFNVAVNSFETGSSYLIAKAIIDSVDLLYVQRAGTTANPMLPALMPVDAADVAAFGLQQPDWLEQRLENAASVWRLYASNYRLQAALFGSSTRLFIYLHKGEVVRRLIPGWRSTAAPSEAGPIADDGGVTIAAPRAPLPISPERRRELRARDELTWRFAELVAVRGKRAVFLQFDTADRSLTDEAIAGFNAAFANSAEIARVHVPESLRFDGLHLTMQGATAVAQALARHEAESGLNTR